MKSIWFEPGKKPNTTRIVMTIHGNGRLAKRRQFTVSDWELEGALKSAGLFRTVEKVAPPTTEAEQLQLANEIAWYVAQADRTGGTPSAASIAKKLWSRINAKLGLS